MTHRPRMTISTRRHGGGRDGILALSSCDLGGPDEVRELVRRWVGPNADRALTLARGVARVHRQQVTGEATSPVDVGSQNPGSAR